MTDQYNPTEHEETVTVANYLAWLRAAGEVIIFSKIAHEVYTKSWKQKRKNKLEGLNRGVPDFLIVFANGIVLFLELKRIKGGQLSTHQMAWIDALKQTNCEVAVAPGSQEAINIINKLKEM